MTPQDKKKSIFQVSLGIVFIASYIWIVEPHASLLVRNLFLWGLCVGFPIFCIARDQRSFPELSLDWKAFVRCLRILIWFTLAASVFLVSLALVRRSVNYDDQFLRRVSEYLFWAFLQQIGLQMFLTYRVKKIFVSPYKAAFASALIFAALHWPNPSLVAFSFVGGIFWAYSYIKVPNLYALAVSHGWLAVMALHCVPKSWLHGLRVGPSFWTY